MSVTEIRYNAPRKSLEISCRIFTDDLENVLKKEYKTALDIMKPKDRAVADSMISRYLRQHLVIAADGRKLPLHYLGYQITDDAAWCFLEYTPVGNFTKLDLLNDVLYAEHETQSHMIHVIRDDKRQSTKIDNPKSAASFSF